MPATDIFSSTREGTQGPATAAAAITPSDTGEMAYVSRAVYVGATGNVRLVMKNGATVTLQNVPAGALLPVRVRKVMATGTTASGLVAFW